MLKNAQLGLMVAAAVVGATLPVRADLPGLPSAAVAQVPASANGAMPKADSGTPKSVRPGDDRPVEVSQPTPIRGSLFAQGAAASSTVALAAGNAENHVSPVNLIAVAPAQPRHYHKNDVVTVIVREDSDSETTGQGNSKKTQDFDLAVKQFLQLALSQSGLPTVGTVNNPASLPEIKFAYNNDSKANASQSRSDSFSARISATVVDVKPNGTMVVEAIKQITVDKEVQTFKLTGVCRAEDIAVDNTLLSTQLANLTISKQTTGIVHDGTKRGWLNQLIDRVSPF